MFMLMPRALLCARFTGADAGFDHGTQHGHILRSPPHGQLRGRLAYVSAVEAAADTLTHVHMAWRAAVVSSSLASFTSGCSAIIL